MCLGVDQSLPPWEEYEQPLRWSLVTDSNLARAVVWAMIAGGGTCFRGRKQSSRSWGLWGMRLDGCLETLTGQPQVHGLDVTEARTHSRI